MAVWKDTARVEVIKGGGESPCPFCKIPRSRRSDYIRCCKCGVNWMTGEILDHDPTLERKERFLAQVFAMGKPKEKKDER